MKHKLILIESALAHLEENRRCCRLCPQECGTDRSRGERGICGGGNKISLASALLHFGEEPVISGVSDCSHDPDRERGGSGTLFFSGCSMKCLFCQNYQISWEYRGQEHTPRELAEKMLNLQDHGALNINLVSPTHFLIQILEALQIAYSKGLKLPLIYNSSGYERKDILKHMEGIIDVYLPDFKYYSSDLAVRFSSAIDYSSRARSALEEMYLQRPTLRMNSQGIAEEGLIVRHLVLPGLVQDSIRILRWIAKNLSVGVPLSLMSQYQPRFKAPRRFKRKLDPEEYQRVVDAAKELGFLTVFHQPLLFQKNDHRMPNFERDNPFDWD